MARILLITVNDKMSIVVGPPRPFLGGYETVSRIEEVKDGDHTYVRVHHYPEDRGVNLLYTDYPKHSLRSIGYGD